MAIAGCSSCGGAPDMSQMLREIQAEQVGIAEKLATQNVALQIDATAAEGVAETIDIAV